MHEYYNSIKAFDVGIDSAIQLLGEYKPFTYDYLSNIIDKREVIA